MSMILLSSKAYNIASLVHSDKAVLTEKKVDPFLHMVEDHKLQAISIEPDNLTIGYGCKEDDDRALRTLSELSTIKHQTQEFFASEIFRNLESLSEPKLSSLRERLLEEFSPDDMCQFGSQLTRDLPKKDASILSTDDDFVPDSFDSQTKHMRRFLNSMKKLSLARQTKPEVTPSPSLSESRQNKCLRFSLR